MQQLQKGHQMLLQPLQPSFGSSLLTELAAKVVGVASRDRYWPELTNRTCSRSTCFLVHGLNIAGLNLLPVPVAFNWPGSAAGAVQCTQQFLCCSMMMMILQCATAVLGQHLAGVTTSAQAFARIALSDSRLQVANEVRASCTHMMCAAGSLYGLQQRQALPMQGLQHNTVSRKVDVLPAFLACIRLYSTNHILNSQHCSGVATLLCLAVRSLLLWWRGPHLAM
jgi:hypothetical protein